ncbi:MAG: Chaperone protein DnaJ [candidate division WS2 bacterium ADurb.Bin280]|uniref:Chaperone protein DnaJ n=1 Tax=candidate division WS2 bacterium ADurb.Bin280 TaxID=1852829 RepID=A0A1V5SEF7_9BACT|nr:MAG: Chaperone protein DnaJ [candidate division WS2 bacterium ADurb.Bin280]
MASDYYEILGVAKDASSDEIKKAYRKKALEHHPDRGGNQDEFKKINEAYQTLGDPQKRASYDRFGKAGVNEGFSQGFGGGQTGGFGGFEDFSGGFGFNFGGGLGDIFGDFFSQAMSTVQAQVEISVAQAVLGDTLHISVADEKIDFEIPSGTQDGTQFRFQGKGRAMRNGKKGDLIIEVRVKIPQKISKQQRELYEKLRQSEQEKKSWWNK